MHDLGTIGVGSRSAAYAVNASGQIVGIVFPPSAPHGHQPPSMGFIYSKGKMVDLNALIAHLAGSCIDITAALAINDKGWIAAPVAVPNILGKIESAADHRSRKSVWGSLDFRAKSAGTSYAKTWEKMPGRPVTC